jgi:hypothetical protein
VIEQRGRQCPASCRGCGSQEVVSARTPAGGAAMPLHFTSHSNFIPLGGGKRDGVRLVL